ncbi:hypothetical protein SO694_00208026 [Aureococcus anophagefferens]|uniref:Exocyst subunit Exo70 family protein n=1 Tax=Aureococcus anophagefferens TaxID=44056 RepID=A0ABR1FNR9_AURAN
MWLAYMDRLSGTTVSDAHERLYGRVANLFIENFHTFVGAYQTFESSLASSFPSRPW